MSNHSSSVNSQPTREWVDPLTALLDASQLDSDVDDPAMKPDDLSVKSDIDMNALVNEEQAFQTPMKGHGFYSKNQSDINDSFSNMAVQEEVSRATVKDEGQQVVLGKKSSSIKVNSEPECSVSATIEKNDHEVTPQDDSPNVDNGSFDLLQYTLDFVGMLPGEKLIMHLNKVYDVAEGSYDIGLNLSPSGIQRIHSNLVGEQVTINSGSVNMIGINESPTWSAVVTFYRVILYCYPKYRPEYDRFYSMAHNMNCLSQKWKEVRELNHGKIPNEKENEKGCKPIILQMPLACIDNITRMDGNQNATPTFALNTNRQSNHLALLLTPKDHRPILRFSCESLGDCIRAQEAIQTYAFPGRRNLGYLFAFESKRPSTNVEDPNENVRNSYIENRRYKHYSAYKEFERQGCLRHRGKQLSPWTLTAANSSYQLCPSYPANLVVPMGASESEGKKGAMLLMGSAAFRSEGRLPSLTWGSSRHCGSIWRSSQPRVGLQTNRSNADESYLQLLVDAVNQQRKGRDGGDKDDVDYSYKILDLRPKSSAMANRTQGYGYETPTGYPSSELKFCNIGNIHAVKSSWDKICKLHAVGCHDEEKLLRWGALVEETKWLNFTRLILKAAHECATDVYYQEIPVLVHCSHGWDRTSQVCALAQILLDPYYRTFTGFAVIVEKDFLSFGHPFHLRCAHGESMSNSSSSEQSSPIFIQFLDAVYQLVHMFPEYFEFDENYLRFVANHLYSCRFGTFLCDNERDRIVRASLHEKTYALWDASYNGNRNIIEKSKQVPLLPPLSSLLQGVQLWQSYFKLFR